MIKEIHDLFIEYGIISICINGKVIYTIDY